MSIIGSFSNSGVVVMMFSLLRWVDEEHAVRLCVVTGVSTYHVPPSKNLLLSFE